jgi:hypothetical protein
MFLFDSIKRQLSEKTIEEVNRPGQATTMLGLLQYPRGFAKAQGWNQLRCKDTLDELTAENQGYSTRQSYVINKPVGDRSALQYRYLIKCKKLTSLNIVLRKIKSYVKNCKDQFC